MTKKMKIFGLSLLSLFAASCGDNEDVIYNPNGSQGVIYFERNTGELAIAQDDAGTLEMKIFSSNLSPVARVINVTINEARSTADPANYSVPATVTIPANAYFGTLVIEGTDVTATTAPEVLVVNISGAAGTSDQVSTTALEISVYEFCPILENGFTGSYLITEVTPFVDGPTLSNNTVVTLVADSYTRRSFQTGNYVDYCAPMMTFRFALVCGEVIVDGNQRSTCACSAAGLFFGPASTPATFDPEDDSEFFVTFTNDVTGDCSSATQTTYKFTKQQ